jgi:hypothetical protein
MIMTIYAVAIKVQKLGKKRIILSVTLPLKNKVQKEMSVLGMEK